MESKKILDNICNWIIICFAFCIISLLTKNVFFLITHPILFITFLILRGFCYLAIVILLLLNIYYMDKYNKEKNKKKKYIKDNANFILEKFDKNFKKIIKLNIKLKSNSENKIILDCIVKIKEDYYKEYLNLKEELYKNIEEYNKYEPVKIDNEFKLEYICLLSECLNNNTLNLNEFIEEIDCEDELFVEDKKGFFYYNNDNNKAYFFKELFVDKINEIKDKIS